MNYNDINRHHRDNRIHFDAATHTYSVDCADGSSLPCVSVTTVVENLFAKFDADYWAQRKATPQRPAHVIKEEWARKGQIARELGTILHDRIERHYFGEEPDAEALADRAFCNFLSFARQHRLQPYRSEWRIFSEKYAVAGTLDFLACTDGRFEIYDWKRSSKIVTPAGEPITYNAYGNHAFAPIAHIPDCTYQHYAMQVSLYRLLLELEYGIVARAGYLGTFHPDYDRPHIVEMPYYRDEAQAVLDSLIK